ncbi:helix-turn-helix domain-containing protein [Fusibacter ferrireducens]|uniref:Helix-turn-helix transcriptional regulator n=1 Tax=Fusibacter ferrireducens TaxID=2785058 RepID=A0ABR9ZU10_9FIRM|nr:helix-turn-helix transcriptional regulator [Fusibacter ferrireducens]MBF4693971.1 helix-turn-helix transcriptional regulator [Fusibacter ferrireducens]
MLGTRLRELRNEKNLTQNEISQLLKIPRGTNAHYELDKRQPDNDTLKSLADFFDVSLDYLLGRTDIKKYTEDILAFNSTEGLTEDDLKLVHQMIQNMRDKNLSKK